MVIVTQEKRLKKLQLFFFCPLIFLAKRGMMYGAGI
jgi:hypothetical protein